jgi:uncharacterized membrane protein
MTPGALAAMIPVPAVGIMMVIAAVITRRTSPFAVRIPYPERIVPPVIRRQRLLYLRRTTVVCLCATAIAFTLALQGHTGQWLARLALVGEIAADVACLQLARRKIIAVKIAEDWFADVRQTVVTDTTWRADPPRFPVAWLLPALAVLAATLIIGALRYPDLPSRLLGTGGRLVPKSPLNAYGFAIGQVYATALATGILLLVHRARPEIEARDPAGSAARQRALLRTFTRAIMTLITGVDLTLLLAALQRWQLWRPAGAAGALIVVPVAAGLVALIVMLWRTWRAWPTDAGDASARVADRVADRDDDRFWKLGLLYVNRDDPALMVSARFGLGWMLNLGNPRAWLLIAGIWAIPAGLAAILLAAGA